MKFEENDDGFVVHREDGVTVGQLTTQETLSGPQDHPSAKDEATGKPMRIPPVVKHFPKDKWSFHPTGARHTIADLKELVAEIEKLD